MIEQLFLNKKAKLGTAAQRCCTQLAPLEGTKFEKVKHHLQLSHLSAHGKWKGSGSHASSASAMPPSFVAVAAHGEWSIGKMRMFMLSLLWDETNINTK